MFCCAKKSFTLTEAIVAIIVLGVGIVGFYALLNLGNRFTEKKIIYAQARHLGKMYLNEILSKSFSDPQNPLSFGREESTSIRDSFDDVDELRYLIASRDHLSSHALCSHQTITHT